MFKYICSPYTSNEVIQQHRYQAALRCLTHFTKLGAVCFSPIVHNHPIAVLMREGDKSTLPTDGRDIPRWDYWEKFDRVFLESASALWILAIDGWRESVGIKAEVEIAKELGLPLFIVTENGVGNYYRDEYSYSEFAKAVKS